MVCSEFPPIARYSNRVRSSRLDVELGIGDNCALLNTPEKQTLVISIGTLAAGNHFLPGIDPADLAYKALAMNLGDLAAMGADPAWLTLVLALPNVDEVWLESFSDSLSDLLNHYDIRLIGGGTMCRLLPTTLGTHSFVLTGRALARSEVKSGDWIYVTSTPGDSAAGLATLQNRSQVADAKDMDYLIKRHFYPSPCILQRQVLCGLANSAIDLSDGLASDLGYIVKASDCGTHIDLTLLPLPDVPSRHAESERALRWALSGGEGHELCFTVPELDRDVLDMAPRHLGVPFACIGQMTTDIEGLCLTRDGEPVMSDWKGYDHFITP